MATGIYVPTITGVFFELSIIVLFLWPSREKIFQLKKCHINHFKIYNSVALIGFTVLHNHYVCFQTLPSPQTETLYLLSNTPHSRNPHNLVTSKLLFCVYEFAYSRYIIQMESCNTSFLFLADFT